MGALFGRKHCEPNTANVSPTTHLFWRAPPAMAADIPTLSKLLEASLDPRQNKQGTSVGAPLLLAMHQGTKFP